MIQFDYNMFQMGWNHHLVMFFFGEVLIGSFPASRQPLWILDETSLQGGRAIGLPKNTGTFPRRRQQNTWKKLGGWGH